MPLHSNLNPTCGNTLRLGISVALRPPSVAFLELLDNYRKSKCYDFPTTGNLIQWTNPLIYYGIHGKYRKNVHDELPSTVSLFGQFDVELIPHYTGPYGPSRIFHVGFKFQHEVLEQMRLAFSRWGGECFSHDDIPRSSSNHQLGPHLFYPIQVIKTEDKINVQYAIKELTSLLRNFGNIFTADRLLLQEYWSNIDSTPIYSSTLAAYPLDSSKNRILEGLSKLRILALKEEVIDSHKQRSISTYTSEKIVTRVNIRRIIGIPKYNYEKRMLQQYTETELYHGLLRKVESKKHVLNGPMYYTNNFPIPTLENQITRFKDKRFVQKVPTNLKNFNPEGELINYSKNSSGRISFRESKPNANLSRCLFTESTSKFVPRCTRQEARRLETERLNRPLIRYEKSDLQVENTKNEKEINYDKRAIKFIVKFREAKEFPAAVMVSAQQQIQDHVKRTRSLAPSWRQNLAQFEDTKAPQIKK
ncbi:hypothetical protein EPUL_000887 [Erysiphe pulchra]|uniref:Uncharacterized protein n=1 Tax=Erysiphe pulchra TaxID=225359 RepID=A0A2S4Q1Y4_9PEZI|nr:hypothetical protein EPUL_000887 [Erysiphe pulchra]